MNNQQSSRPAWVEIDLARLRKNFELFIADKPEQVGFISVVKDEAYGHGMVRVAEMALEFGASALAVVTVDEALTLRRSGITAPILVFGERTPGELHACVRHDLTCFVNDTVNTERLAKLSHAAGKSATVHVEIDTGLSRHGVRWSEALPVIRAVAQTNGLQLDAVMSHFAMSDELDKTFALLQLGRFEQVLEDLRKDGLRVNYRHMCNSGGFLDLPQAHFDLVRIGILPLGVYPSRVCRRIPGLKPVMSVKARLAVIRELQPGDCVGYGMRYQASAHRRIAVLQVGYGDGYPRVRNQGAVLIHGRRAPVVGGNAMDAMMVDITDIPQAKHWDEAVLLGIQGEAEIDVHELAKLKGTVSYEVLAAWRNRLPRLYLPES